MKYQNLNLNGNRERLLKVVRTIGLTAASLALFGLAHYAEAVTAAGFSG